MKEILNNIRAKLVMLTLNSQMDQLLANLFQEKRERRAQHEKENKEAA